MMQDVDYQIFFDTVENELLQKDRINDDGYLDRLRKELKHIDLWENRYDHPQNLSGGQKQRLSIARVFLKNPPIIIFDEATSSLHNESEKAVKDSLEKLTENRTTIVIAHRLSTIRNAQKIIVLNNKGIAEQGTHEELIALDGNYANLYNKQLKL